MRTTRRRSEISDDIVHVHGGVVPMIDKINSLGIPEIITENLGKRPPQSKYQYDKAILAYIMSNYCYGHRLRNIESARKGFSIVEELKIPNHVTIGRIFKTLATPTEYTSSVNLKNSTKTKHYAFNENHRLNEMMVMISKRMGLLKEGVKYTLDMDATLIETEVQEANMTYKRHKGFTNLVCSINNIVVSVSVRSGNSGPMWNQLTTLKSTIEMLRDRFNITIDTIRIDGGGYMKELFNYITSQNMKFIIGAKWAKGTYKQFDNAFWEKGILETSTHKWDAEFAIVPFHLTDSKITYYMCASRVKAEERMKNEKEIDFPTKWKLVDGYYYKFIINTEKYVSPKEIVYKYHFRSIAESVFCHLKQSFGWTHPPFGKINENSVYFIITAIASNIYQGLLKYFSKKIYSIEPNILFKTFYDIFICVCFSYDEKEKRYSFKRTKVGREMKDVIFRHLV